LSQSLAKEITPFETTANSRRHSGKLVPCFISLSRCTTHGHHTTPHYTAPHHIAQHHTTLYRATLPRIAPHHTIPHRTAPHHTTPHHIVLRYTAPHCTTHCQHRMSWHSTVRSPQRHQRGTASEQATQQEIQHHAENEKFQEMFQTCLHQREVARYDDQQIGLASNLENGTSAEERAKDMGKTQHFNLSQNTVILIAFFTLRKQSISS
jgi:hypothetical protein